MKLISRLPNAVILVAVLASLFVLPGAAAAQQNAPSSFSEEFNGPTLDPAWQVVQYTGPRVYPPYPADTTLSASIPAISATMWTRRCTTGLGTAISPPTITPHLAKSWIPAWSRIGPSVGTIGSSRPKWLTTCHSPTVELSHSALISVMEARGHYSQVSSVA